MSFAHPSIIVVSGPMAAGKTTLANAIAATVDQAAIINGYHVHQLIVSGLCSPRTQADADASDGAFGLQLRARLRGSCALAKSFVEDGFTAIIEDHVVGERVEHLLEDLAAGPFYFIQLTAAFDELTRREQARGTDGYERWGSWDDLMANQTTKIGLWLDTSGQTVDEAVATVLARASDALVPTLGCLPAGVSN